MKKTFRVAVQVSIQSGDSEAVQPPTIQAEVRGDSIEEVERIVCAGIRYELTRPDPTDPDRLIMVDGKMVPAGPNIQAGSSS